MAPARSMLSNFKQFNSSFGCGYCLHEGVSIQKGRGYARVYPIKHPLPRKRGHDESFNSAIDVVERVLTEINGVKGPSYLYLIPLLNIMDGMIPDSMHCVYLGVVKQFLALWTESPAGCAYHIDAQAIDVILLTIKPTSDIIRLIRSFSVFGKYWKASEYRNFLLLYSAGILKD